MVTPVVSCLGTIMAIMAPMLLLSVLEVSADHIRMFQHCHHTPQHLRAAASDGECSLAATLSAPVSVPVSAGKILSAGDLAPSQHGAAASFSLKGRKPTFATETEAAGSTRTGHSTARMLAQQQGAETAGRPPSNASSAQPNGEQPGVCKKLMWFTAVGGRSESQEVPDRYQKFLMAALLSAKKSAPSLQPHLLYDGPGGCTFIAPPPAVRWARWGSRCQTALLYIMHKMQSDLTHAARCCST
jgi:hypothetical protein